MSNVITGRSQGAAVGIQMTFALPKKKTIPITVVMVNIDHVLCCTVFLGFKSNFVNYLCYMHGSDLCMQLYRQLTNMHI